MTTAKNDKRLAQSYAHCAEISEKRAGHFFHAFRVLPKARFNGMCALYAFTRRADDIADGEEEGAVNAPDPCEARKRLAAWKTAFDRALAGDDEADPLLPAVADTFSRYNIPPGYMHELIVGCEMDAEIIRYESWDDLRLYCRRVASVVGLMTLYVFGFADEKTPGDPPPSEDVLAAGERLGWAFQLTNILRDVKEDAARGRIYLPLEDLRRFSVTENEILTETDSPAFRALILFEAARTKEFYAEGKSLSPKMAPMGRRALNVLTAVYEGLLDKIVALEGDVLSQRVSLSKLEKMRLAAGAALGSRKRA
jgi:phytoene synthase